MTQPIEFKCGSGKFALDVKVLSKEPCPPNVRFGVDTDDVNNFVQDLLKMEIDGRKFRTKFVIPWGPASPLAENFLWTILTNRERKEITNEFTYAKPTAQHWIQLTKEVISSQKFKFWIDRAFSQALWQYITMVPAIDVDGSTLQAKCNSVLTLVHINATRIIFDRLLGTVIEIRTKVRLSFL